MSNSARFRAFSNTLFSKTAWIATVALVASLLVVVPVGGQAANAVPNVMPTSISVGGSQFDGGHSCAVVEKGVRCWGSNASGQLGVAGIFATSEAVQTIAANSGVTQVSAGGSHTCALFETGVIKCWGDNFYGQLGDGTNANRSMPVTVLNSGGSSVATEVSAGYSHTCAIISGAVKCWGKNEQGEIGVSPTSKSSSKTPISVLDSSGAALRASSISAGDVSTCAITGTSGPINCWGSDYSGQLGNGTVTTDSQHVPQQVALVEDDGVAIVTSVSVGNGFACAAVNEGVQCWGDNSYGQLGDGTTESQSSPLMTTDLEWGITEVSAGHNFACAIIDGLSCWGDNSIGQWGTAGREGVVIPLTQDETPVAFDAGAVSACALLVTTLDCWGDNRSGELGNGDVLYKNTPVPSQTIPGLVDLEAGGNFTCALVSDGTVKCWGENYLGKLGAGIYEPDSNDQVPMYGSSEPVTVVEVTGATAISLGTDHACAIVALGKVKCWGNDEDGQLGDGPGDSSGIGAVTAVNSGATSISAGGRHTCAIISDGTVKCWGDNGSGQLGDGLSVDSDLPVDVFLGVIPNVEGFVGFTQIAAGRRHTCVVYAAVTDSYQHSYVNCWGDNYSGQLGDGQAPDARLSPVLNSEVSRPGATLLGVTSISAGTYHTCAVDSSVVRCWGSGTNGELGDGSFSDSFISTESQGSDAFEVLAGDDFSCANMYQGIHCWGANKTGQLGIASVTSANVPTLVVGMSSSTVDTLLAVGFTHACASEGDSVKCWGSNSGFALGISATQVSSVPVEASGVLRNASLTPGNDVVQNGGQQSAAVDPATMLKPELAKANRISVLKTGQRITLNGTNLSNVKSVMVGSKNAKILSSSGSEIVIEVPANLFGLPQVTLVSSSGIQTIDGLMQIVQPYVARSVKVSSFKGNSLTKAAALIIRKSYQRDTSVNTVVCAAVIGKGTSARVKAATIAKSVSACSTVSGYSVKFSEFKIAVRTLKTPLKTPYVTVTLSRSTPSLVN